MAIARDTKRAILAKLAVALADASSVAFVGFSKLTVADSSKLRKELSRSGVRYRVAKKSLLRLALSERGYGGQAPDLPGEVAIAWTEGDVTAPTRGVYEFGEKLKGTLALLGGVFEGAFIGAVQATAIARIPPLPALRGMFANVINSPLRRFAIALNEVAKTKS